MPICPSVYPSARSALPFQFPFRTPLSISVLTVTFPKFFFFCLKGITSEIFILYFLSVRLSVRTPFQFSFLPFNFQNSFFVWKLSHQRPNFYNSCPCRLSVRPFRTPLSIFVPYPPFNFRSNWQISKIIFLFERYNIRDLALYFLSVCPFHIPFQQ